MKRAIALLLTLLTLCAALPAGSFAAPSDGETRAALPASATLVGSAALPPVPNQGGVGSCASEAIAYRQFTNAVGRYMNAVAPDVDWNPASGKKEQIFSPKYTYTLSGSGTAWVYNVLVDHGCLPTSVSSFWKSADGGSQYKKDGVLVKSAVKWDVENDLMQTALSYRLKNYEQIWVNRAPYVSTETPKVNGFDNVQITTSEAGRTLITKIKDALLRGNAVVTGGYISRWLTGHLTGDGEIGKAGDPAIIASAGNAAGGHQVTIVGYDDKIECKVGNSTMKGGFLVANSWGPDWGKDGCEWLMYDALNTVSEFEEYNKEGFYSGDMFIDALNDTTVVMNPSYSATGDQTVTFTKAGTVRVSGENYTTYNLYSEALGGYLAYSTTSSDRSLRIEKTAGKNTAWAFIPYEKSRNGEPPIKNLWTKATTAAIGSTLLGERARALRAMPILTPVSAIPPAADRSVSLPITRSAIPRQRAGTR